MHEGGWRIHGDSAESLNLTFIGPHGRTINEIGERPRPAHEQLPVDPTIDADTIATAEGGRCDLDLAITAIASISTSRAPRDFEGRAMLKFHDALVREERHGDARVAAEQRSRA